MHSATCTVCEETKLRTGLFWPKDPRAPDGLRRQCKACISERQKKQYAEKCADPQFRERQREANRVVSRNAKRRKSADPLKRLAISQQIKERAARRAVAPLPLDGRADKPCGACGQSAPLTTAYWHRDNRSADGFCGDCKICRNKKRSAIYAADCEKPAYREQRRQAQAAFYAANFEKNRLACAAYGAANAERLRQKACERYQRNPERYRENAKRWQQANAERYRIIRRSIDATRRARKRNAQGTHTAEEIIAILVEQNFECFWCYTDVSDGQYHVDHYLPLAKGGSNSASNIVIACRSCNCMKSDKLPEEFRAYLARRQANNA